MDEQHNGLQSQSQAPGATGEALASAARAVVGAPIDDEERFIVGLVLSYYRRDPRRARTQLLGLLGEALVPAAWGAGEPHAQAFSTVDRSSARTGGCTSAPPPPTDESLAPWQGARRGAAEEAALIGHGLTFLHRRARASSPALPLTMQRLALAQALCSTGQQAVIRPIPMGFRSTNRSDTTMVHSASKASFAA